MKNRTATLLLAVLLLLLAEGTAWSKKDKQNKSGDFYLSATFGGYPSSAPRGLDGETFQGVKLGYDIQGVGIVDGLGIEGFAALAETEEKDRVYQFRVDTIHPLRVKKKLIPFLALGGGWVDADTDSLVEDGVIFSLGFGSTYALTNYLMLRADFRKMVWFEPGQDNYLESSVGISYLFGQERIKKPQPPPDADRDGVADAQDNCPDTPRGIAVDKQGCPTDTSDGDGDSVPDYRDWCKETLPGTPVDQNGCPKDSDGDGIPDFKDRCPGTPHGMEVDGKGCVKLSDSPTSSIPVRFATEPRPLGTVTETAKVEKPSTEPVAPQGGDMVNPDLLPIESAPVVMPDEPLIELPVAADGEVGAGRLDIAAVEVPILVHETVSSPVAAPIADASEENVAGKMAGGEASEESRSVPVLTQEATNESKEEIVVGDVAPERAPIDEAPVVIPQVSLVDVPVAVEGETVHVAVVVSAVEIPAPVAGNSLMVEAVTDASETNEAGSIAREEAPVESLPVRELSQQVTSESKDWLVSGTDAGGERSVERVVPERTPSDEAPVALPEEPLGNMPVAVEGAVVNGGDEASAVEIPAPVPVSSPEAGLVAAVSEVSEAGRIAREEGGAESRSLVQALPQDVKSASKHGVAAGHDDPERTPIDDAPVVMPQEPLVVLPVMTESELGVDGDTVNVIENSVQVAVGVPERESAAATLKATADVVRIEAPVESRPVQALSQHMMDESKGGLVSGPEGGGDPSADGAGSKPVPLKRTPVAATQEPPVDLTALDESGVGVGELAAAAGEVQIPDSEANNPLDEQAEAEAADVKETMNDVRRKSWQASVESGPVLTLPREAQPEPEEILATTDAGATDTATEVGQTDAVGMPGMIRVEFDFDRSEVQEGFRTQLTTIAERLEMTGEKIRIEGHTDSKGSHAYNDRLSKQRALSVKADLQGMGIEPVRMTAVGYGERLPIADNATESGRQKNRRAVIRFSEDKD